MQEAINQVKAELGRDAMILQTRRLKKGGLFGLFGKERFEVMAAVDPAAKAPAPLPQNPPYRPQPPAAAPAQEGTGLAGLRRDVSHLQKLMEQVVQALPERSAASPLQRLLLDNDVEAEAAALLIQGFPEATDETRLPLVKEQLKDRLRECFNRVEVIVPRKDTCQIAAFIGPTGVGKTTTIAKLAANFTLKEGLRLVLITADTYRIAAMEQLKTYADIIGIPLEVVYSSDELTATIARHRDKDLILIDTAGRSPKNRQQIQELQSLLAVEPAIETYLVINTGAKYRDALEMVNGFSCCSPSKFLFTKVDESANIGTIINLLYRFPLALSYIATGQNVPDDIEIADPGKLADRLVES